MKNADIEQAQEITEADKIHLLIEYDKVRIEWFKGWSLVVSIFVPLIIAILATMYNIRLQDRRAQIDFELKATEIVMTASSPAAAANKAAVLTELFPDRLSSQFKTTFQRLYGSQPLPQ